MYVPQLQPYCHVLQQVSVQSASCSPPVVTVLQTAVAEQQLVPDMVMEVPKLLMPQADSNPVSTERVTHSLSHNQAYIQHLQQVKINFQTQLANRNNLKILKS